MGEGSISGRMSADGKSYELVQSGQVKRSYPRAIAHADEKLKQAIIRNGWDDLK